MARSLPSAIVVALVLTATAHGLVTMSLVEQFGPPPKIEQKPTDYPMAISHLPGRAYWIHSTWDGFGSSQEEGLVACEGDIDAVNGALAEFAQIKATAKEVLLVPGPGRIESKDRKNVQACDYKIHWTSNTVWNLGDGKQPTSSHSAVMTIYIARAEPTPALDPRAADWIKELDDERFAVRQRAFNDLAKLADAALPLLHKALASNPSEEQKTRLERLIAQTRAIHPAHLKIPKGVQVVPLQRALEREEKNWRSGELAASWHASPKISAWAEHSEKTLPLLVEMLNDSRVQVRDLALQAFDRLGARASSTLPALKAALPIAKAEQRAALERAVATVMSSPAIDVEAYWATNRSILAGILRHAP